MLDFMFATPKRHILGRNGVFWRILRQNPSRALGCSELQEPKKNQKTNTFLVRKVTHARRLGGSWLTFAKAYGVHDVITCADLYYDRLRGLGVARGGQFWLSPLTCFVALTTLSHYRASVWYYYIVIGAGAMPCFLVIIFFDSARVGCFHLQLQNIYQFPNFEIKLYRKLLESIFSQFYALLVCYNADFSLNLCCVLSKMPVDRREDRLHYGRRVSDVCKARELQWLRCGSPRVERIHQSASQPDKKSCSGHGPTADVKQHWAPSHATLPRTYQSYRNHNIYSTSVAGFLAFYTYTSTTFNTSYLSSTL